MGIPLSAINCMICCDNSAFRKPCLRSKMEENIRGFSVKMSVMCLWVDIWSFLLQVALVNPRPTYSRRETQILFFWYLGQDIDLSELNFSWWLMVSQGRARWNSRISWKALVKLSSEPVRIRAGGCNRRVQHQRGLSKLEYSFFLVESRQAGSGGLGLEWQLCEVIRLQPPSAISYMWPIPHVPT